MQSSYPQAIAAVLRSEGGYVNNPHDPGGATNFGITQAVYTAYLTRIGTQYPSSVQNISQAEVQAIYKAQYWDAVHGDDLPVGVDYCVFDYGVNSGPSRAIKALQEALGVTVDGVIGGGTIAAVRVANAFDLISKICNSRLTFLQGLTTWSTFGRGWAYRISRVKLEAVGMVNAAMVSNPVFPPPVQPPVITPPLPVPPSPVQPPPVVIISPSPVPSHPVLVRTVWQKLWDWFFWKG